MTAESQLETMFRRKVKAAGGMIIKLAPMQAGVPDRLVLLDGRMWLVELKTSTGKLSEIQKHWHGLAALQGITVTTLYGATEINDWVRGERN